MNHMDDQGFRPIMCIILCVCTTPAQRDIVWRRVEVKRKEYMDILNYFINESGHPGYGGIPLPENVPRPTFVEDKETENNTDTSANKKTLLITA